MTTTFNRIIHNSSHEILDKTEDALRNASSARCGDIFLPTFEWSPPSPIPANVSCGDNSKNVGVTSDKRVTMCMQGKINNSASASISNQQNVDSELGRSMKRPFSLMSHSVSSIEKDTFERGLRRDTKQSSVLTSNCLEDVIQCGSSDHCPKVVVTSASFPYHVEWVSSSWTKTCGWSCDEILGLDCKFLQGDATDKDEIGRFMTQLMVSGGHASLDILNYNKDDTLCRNVLKCVPIVDDCGPDNSKRITHIAAILVDSREEQHSSECAELMEQRALSEVGMPLDRREGCRSCSNMNMLRPINSLDWMILTDGLPLAHMMRYMIRSQGAIVLTNRDNRIVHVNIGWVTLTGYSAADCEGVHLSALIGTDEDVDVGGFALTRQHSADSSPSRAPSSGAITPLPSDSGTVYLRRRSVRRPMFHSSASKLSLDSYSSDGLVPSLPTLRLDSSFSPHEAASSEKAAAAFPFNAPTSLSPVEYFPVPIGRSHHAVLFIAAHAEPIRR